MITKMRKSRLLAGLSIGVISAVTMSLSVAPIAGASPNPGPNTLVPVPGGVRVSTLPGVVPFGNTPPSTPETVSFVLDEQNLPQLEASVERGITNYVSVGQFAQIYGQNQWNISQLQNYLAQYGITTTVYPDDVDVVANGTAGDFDSALAVQQEQYHVPGRPGRGGLAPIPAQTVHGATGSPELPYRIAQYVAAILGLTNYSPFASQAVHVDTSVTAPQEGSSNACLALTGLANACNTPANYASNYGLDPLYQRGAEGQGQTIAIVTLAALDPGAPQSFWQNVLGLPASSRTVTVEDIDGGPGAPSAVAGTTETDLDVEQSGAVAPDANVIVYQAPNTDYGFADAFFTAASQDIAGTVSASWLESETYLLAAIVSGQESAGYEVAFDEAFLEMAAQGQAGFIASGDWGAYTASVDIGTTNLSVGASSDSPYITAAGGTTLPWSGTLTGPDGSAPVNVPNQRTWGWDYLWQPIATITGQTLAEAAESAVAGSGGGFSAIERTPSYQEGVPGTSVFSAVPYLTPTDYQKVGGLVLPTAWNFNPTPPVVHGFGSGRAVPDASADADPYSGYLLYAPSFAQVGDPVLEGGWGGTSFVAPQFNGTTAVIDSYLGRRVGFWNPSIYGFATERRSSPFTALNQSGTGSDNIYYTGTPGTLFNEGSGLGIPNFSQLASDFAGGRPF